MADSIKGLRLLQPDTDASWYEDMLVASNWARHSPPPGAQKPLARPGGVWVSELEAFRITLYGEQRSGSVAGEGDEGGGLLSCTILL